MADEQSPTVEIAPTVVVLNSNEDSENGLEPNNLEIAGDVAAAIVENAAAAGNGISPHSEGITTDGASPVVAIAEIEASRDVTIASIENETERERIELEASRLDNNEEYQECRREIAALTERVEQLTILLTPPQVLVEEVIAEELETALEQNLTEPSTAAPIVEIETEHSGESLEENPEPETPNRVRKYTAI